VFALDGVLVIAALLDGCFDNAATNGGRQVTEAQRNANHIESCVFLTFSMKVRDPDTI
jgi:hypothetical protein